MARVESQARKVNQYLSRLCGLTAREPYSRALFSAAYAMQIALLPIGEKSVKISSQGFENSVILIKEKLYDTRNKF